MQECTTSNPLRHFSARASLAAIGLKLCEIDLFGPIRARVQIAQKTVKHQPVDKLLDAFIAILSGAHGLVEINTRLRSDTVVQRAFGRPRCAEQSVVQETLDACTAENVTQMEEALDEIYRTHSQGYRHEYEQSLLVLDVDLSGWPCGRKAAFASKGYFAKQPNRRGRQLGRVYASAYQEVVVDRLYAGRTQLHQALQPLMEAAARTLALTPAKRARTLLRIDAGAGTVEQVNWLLEQDYQLLVKDFSTRRASRLATTVTQWWADPAQPGREVGWVEEAATAYARPLRRLAVRCRKQDGSWGYGVLLTTLDPRHAQALARPLPEGLPLALRPLLSYLYLYDQRGGAAETSFKGDKQGLGLTKRNKKRWEAQQMVMLLGSLAHNTTVWSRAWLAPHHPAFARFGTLRLVRDLFQVSGLVLADASGKVSQVILNQASPLADGLVNALRPLLAPLQVSVILGEI